MSAAIERESEPRPPARTQFLVIGSGAGGATTAKALAEDGYEVTLLEEGPNVDTSQIDSNSVDAIERLYRNGGMTPILGNQSIAYVEGRCVGGSTEINSGFWHRLPADCYHRWRTDALLEDFSPERLEGYFQRAERDLSVSLLGRDREPPSSAVFRRGIEHLGWDFVEVPRCQKDPSASAFKAGAKQSMRHTYVPRALGAGARLYAGVRVRRILHADGRTSGVEIDIPGGKGTAEIRADAIFICCGAVQTPALLRRSGIRHNVGDNLCIHPMIKAAALFDDEVEALDAPLPMYQVKQFWPTITIGGSVFSPGFLAMILSDNWAENRDAMKVWDRMALYYAGTRGMDRGTIRSMPGGDVMIRYSLTEADRRNLTIGLARLGEVLFAAGARAVYPSVRGLPVLRSAEQCRALLSSPLPVAAMNLSTVHAFSSCPMGENPDFCATDSHGKVTGFANLFVNDASLIPDSPGVNPQGTTMAIAMRNAERFLERGRRPRSRRAPARRPEILVTGAPGWLGTRLVELIFNPAALCEHLPEGGFEGKAVRCLVLRSADGALLEGMSDDLEVCRGDVTDADSLGDFCRDAQGATLFHIAGLIHPQRWTRDFAAVNVEGTRRVIDAAMAGGVRRVVVVSSNSPAGCNPHPQHVFDEQSPYHPYMGYGRSKEAMESLVHRAQETGRIETVIIRPPWFYGPHQPPRQTLFFQMIRAGRFPVLGDGEQRRSMAYVDNICQGLLRAASSSTANGRTYWIADERPYSINEIVATVEQVLEEELGAPPPRRHLRLPSLVGDVATLADGALQAVGIYNQKIHVLGEMNKTIACTIAKAEAELGYHPRIALREGMRRSVRWCVENGYPL